VKLFLTSLGINSLGLSAHSGIADPPAEDNLPAIAIQKTQARQRRHNAQVADLNATRNELHMGNWDG
jgi:hypothetical protein